MAEEGGEDDRYKKKLKAGPIELDPDEPTMIVHYDTVVVDMECLDEDGKPTEVEREGHVQRIRLAKFKISSNAERFAQEIVDKCKYIHKSKLAHVVDLLEQLRERLKTEEDGGGAVAVSAPTRGSPRAALAASPDDDSPQNGRSKNRGFFDDQKASGSVKPTKARAAAASKPVAQADMASEEVTDEPAVRPGGRAGGLKKPPSQRVPDRDRDEPPRESAAQRRQREENERRQREEEDLRMQRELELKEEERKKREAEAAEKARQAEIAAKKAAKTKALQEAQQEFENTLNQGSPRNNHGKANSNSKQDTQLEVAAKKQAKPMEIASMDNIGEYMDLLYGEQEEKVRGSAMLLQLVYADAAHLEYFARDGQLLTTIGRVLDDDRKKSLELTTNILEIFFTFSTFRQLHPLLMDHKVDNTALNIIDFELLRFAQHQADGRELAKDKSQKGKEEAAKLARMLQKQERLLYVCFYLLLNLAEDTDKEVSMKNRKLLQYLLGMLQRKRSPKKPEDQQFLFQVNLLVATFLKKLSIFRENKDDFIKLNIVSQLDYFLSLDNDDVLETVLRLLFNLSFDPSMRDQMVRSGIVEQCVNIFKRPAGTCRPACVRVLYNISMDDRYKESTSDAFTTVAPMVTSLLVRSQGPIDPELLALAINLTSSPVSAEVMAQRDVLKTLFQRVSTTMDPLLMKLVHNIASHENVRPNFRDFIHELVRLVIKANNTDFMVEAMGTLASIPYVDIEYHKLFSSYSLGDVLVRQFIPGMAEDDVILETVMVIGSMLVDPKVALILGTTRFVHTLYTTMVEKGSDPEMVLQIGYVFLKLLIHEGSRDVILEHADLIKSMLSLVADPVPHIRDVANMCLDVIMDFNESWRDRIRDSRFDTLNREWIARALRGVRPSGGGGGSSSLNSSAGSTYLRSQLAPGGPRMEDDRSELKDYSDMYRSSSNPSPVTSSPGGADERSEKEETFKGASVHWDDKPARVSFRDD